ncbi:hypothetical protein ACOMHN_037507 [Nucella lapillus]
MSGVSLLSTALLGGQEKRWSWSSTFSLVVSSRGAPEWKQPSTGVSSSGQGRVRPRGRLMEKPLKRLSVRLAEKFLSVS